VRISLERRHVQMNAIADLAKRAKCTIEIVDKDGGDWYKVTQSNGVIRYIAWYDRLWCIVRNEAEWWER